MRATCKRIGGWMQARCLQCKAALVPRLSQRIVVMTPAVLPRCPADGLGPYMLTLRSDGVIVEQDSTCRVVWTSR